MTAKNALLLPSGLYDLLPPEASRESDAVARLLASFASFGYAQVSPPLLEFETSLLSGRGSALSPQTFRVMDPLSQAMMGFRADITLQVARIARSRLGGEPRPLRLCYAGPILQSTPEALRNERQLTQAGIELIGSDSLHADAEVMIVAAQTIKALGIEDISIDLNLPGLLGELCPEALTDSGLRKQIKDAILRKDSAAIASLPIANNTLLASLAESAGPADKTIATLKKLKLLQADKLKAVAERVQQSCPYASLTVDPIEYRGFDYHEGISFSIFAGGLRHELGRGGRYKVEKDSATGVTLYVTHLLRLLPVRQEEKRVLVPEDTGLDVIAKLHAENWITLYALTKEHRKEAQHLHCSYILEKGKIQNT